MRVVFGTIAMAAIFTAMRRKELRIKIVGTILFVLLIMWLSISYQEDAQYLDKTEANLFNIDTAMGNLVDCVDSATDSEEWDDCMIKIATTVNREVEHHIDDFNIYYK